MAAYAVLGMLVLRAFSHSPYRDRHRFIFWLSVFLTAFYGATDELHQYFVPSRSAEIADFLFDCLGAWTGVWAFEKMALRYPALGRL
jgi:VanZ family protein